MSFFGPEIAASTSSFSYAPSEHPIYQIGRTGIAAPVDSGYQITWNVQKLNSLPPAAHDFILFHECAHARIPTRDELRANCTGLKDMRAAGRQVSPSSPNWLRSTAPGTTTGQDA